MQRSDLSDDDLTRYDETGYTLVRGLAETVTPIEFQSALPEPPDLAERGIYVDPVYG